METLQKQTLENFKFNFITVGEVVSVDDPLFRGRVRVRIMGIISDDILDHECPWAEQSANIMSGTKERIGNSTVPEKGSFVYLSFLLGDPSKPVYFGVARGNKDSAEIHKIQDLAQSINQIRKDNKVSGNGDNVHITELDPLNENTKYPKNTVINTPKDNIIELDDTDGNERIGIEHGMSGSYFEIRPDGTIQIKSMKHFYEIIKDSAFKYIEGNLNELIEGYINREIKGNITELIAGAVDKHFKSNLTILVDGNRVITATTDHNGNYTINGSLTVTGGVTSLADVVAGGISLMTHVHGGVTSGGGSTSTPI